MLKILGVIFLILANAVVLAVILLTGLIVLTALAVLTVILLARRGNKRSGQPSVDDRRTG